MALSFFGVRGLGSFLRTNRGRILALFACFCALLFPASLAGRQPGASPLAGFGWHQPFVTTSLLLMGVSPYNTRATGLWINGYRLALYALILFCLVLAFQAARRTSRKKGHSLGLAFLLCTALLIVALPFMPDSVGGGVYFATRIFFLLWVGAGMAASSTRESRLPGRPLLFSSVAVLLAALTLVPAELYLRPVARDLLAEEAQPLPANSQGVLLVSYDVPEYVRFHKQLAFDPYYWGTALAAVRQNDVLLDAPWMNLDIIPIARRAGSQLIQGGLESAHSAMPGSPRYGRSLPAAEESRLVQNSQFVLFAGTPEELAHGLAVQLDPAEAARYGCGAPSWYLACTKK